MNDRNGEAGTGKGERTNQQKTYRKSTGEYLMSDWKEFI